LYAVCTLPDADFIFAAKLASLAFCRLVGLRLWFLLDFPSCFGLL
jgi:hypothetical protein